MLYMDANARHLSRRSVLTGAILTALCVTTTSVQSQTGGVIVSTRSGRIRGRLAYPCAASGCQPSPVAVFQGVRYGASTAGRRFLPPQRPASWSDVVDTLDYGNEAPQPFAVEASRPTRIPGSQSWRNPRPQSEDCLFLNVYSALPMKSVRRPVMVWLHGGGFSSGSADSRYADGTRLASRGDVVIVSVNHRLNAFGYLYLGNRSAAHADSGNAGTLDIVLALQWVRDNIAVFGGDPNNVTVFGQSGGGEKVSCLMTVPAAAGLFHKAIVQSGPGIVAVTPDQARATTDRVLEALNLRPDAISALSTLPMEAVRNAVTEVGEDSFGPVVDGRAMPRHPFEPDAPPLSRNVSLLIGSLNDEYASYVGAVDPSVFDMTWDDLPARLAKAIPWRGAETIIRQMRGAQPFAKPCDIYITAVTDAIARRPTILQAERKAEQGGAPAFMYLFAWSTPIDGGKWKCPHGMELPFVFDTLGSSASMLGPDREINPDMQSLVTAVSSAWVNFARSGNPGWPSYTVPHRSTMVFGVPSRVVDDPRAVERRLFEAGPPITWTG